MSGKRDDDQDMSMEEILASIRKYVTDEPKPTSQVVNEDDDKEESILELTEPLAEPVPCSQDGELPLPIHSKTHNTEAAVIPPVLQHPPSQPIAVKKQSEVQPSHPTSIKEVRMTPQKPSTTASDTGISSTQTVSASVQALSRLKEANRVNNKATPAAGFNGSASIEEFMASLARPMIKDWLDAHLPGIVEAMVAKEIERITKQLAQD